jgi:hypothetical protein
MRRLQISGRSFSTFLLDTESAFLAKKVFRSGFCLGLGKPNIHHQWLRNGFSNALSSPRRRGATADQGKSEKAKTIRKKEN